MQVADPSSNIIFSANAVEDDEFRFHTRAQGTHVFCLVTSPQSKRLRGRRWIPVQIDITVGETWSHDRVRAEHVDELMDDISDLAERIQELRSDMVHLKYRETRHRCARARSLARRA